MVVGINLPQCGQLIPGICGDVPPETAFSSSSVRVYSFVSLFLLSMFVRPFFILNICFVIRQSRRDFSAYPFSRKKHLEGAIPSLSPMEPMLWRAASVAEFKIVATAALAVVFFQRSELPYGQSHSSLYENILRLILCILYHNMRLLSTNRTFG